MTSQLITKPPHTIVDHIKLFTGEGCWRNGKYIHIHRISKNDFRYEMLSRRPRIKQLNNSFDINFPIRGTTWFKTSNNKFMVINVAHTTRLNGVYVNEFIWEVYYNQTRIVIPLH